MNVVNWTLGGLMVGLFIGWLIGTGFMYAQAIRSCPESENTQCEYFGHQKICLVGEK